MVAEERPDGRGIPRVLAYIVAATMFMAQLDSTIVATALPQMARGFDTMPANLSLGISIYLLAQAILLPASSWVSDRCGARRTFAAAVLLFTLTSVLCGLSGTLSQFVGARVLQGAAAALMTPVGRVALIRSTDRRHLVQVLTMTSTPMLIAPTLGPPLGGFIVTYLSWPWVFYLNVPIGLLCVPLILRFVPDIREEVRKPFDFVGFVLVALALTGLIYGLDRITAPGSRHLFAGVCVVIGVAAGAAAMAHARRTPHPLLSLTPLRSPIFRAVTLTGGAFARLPMRALPFIIPLAFQVGMGMSAFLAGLLVMASSGGDLIAKPFVKPILRRRGFRYSLFWSQVASSAIIATLGAAFTAVPYPVLFVLLALSGVARSVLFSGMSSLLYAEIDEPTTGAATVLWNVAQQVSNALAVSVTVIALNLFAWAHGDYGDRPTIADFRLTMFLLAMIGIPALVSFHRLRSDAGAGLSGHRSGRVAPKG